MRLPAAGSSGSLFHGEVWGDACAAADTIAARLKPATSTGSLARPNRVVKVIAQPAFQNRKGGFAVVQNYGEPRQHYLQTYPSWPGLSRPSTSYLGLVKKAWKPGTSGAKTRFALLPGHDEASALIPENS